MNEYKTEYPGVVLLDDSTQHKLTMDDNQKRVLITETNENLEKLYEIFQNEGFNETHIEEKKQHQKGNGFLKTLSDDWDMHTIRIKDPDKITFAAEILIAYSKTK